MLFSTELSMKLFIYYYPTRISLAVRFERLRFFFEGRLELEMSCFDLPLPLLLDTGEDRVNVGCANAEAKTWSGR